MLAVPIPGIREAGGDEAIRPRVEGIAYPLMLQKPVAAPNH